MEAIKEIIKCIIVGVKETFKHFKKYFINEFNEFTKYFYDIDIEKLEKKE